LKLTRDVNRTFAIIIKAEDEHNLISPESTKIVYYY